MGTTSLYARVNSPLSLELSLTTGEMVLFILLLVLLHFHKYYHNYHYTAATSKSESHLHSYGKQSNWLAWFGLKRAYRGWTMEAHELNPEGLHIRSMIINGNHIATSGYWTKMKTTPVSLVFQSVLWSTVWKARIRFRCRTDAYSESGFSRYSVLLLVPSLCRDKVRNQTENHLRSHFASRSWVEYSIISHIIPQNCITCCVFDALFSFQFLVSFDLIHGSHVCFLLSFGITIARVMTTVQE